MSEQPSAEMNTVKTSEFDRAMVEAWDDHLPWSPFTNCVRQRMMAGLTQDWGARALATRPLTEILAEAREELEDFTVYLFGLRQRVLRLEHGMMLQALVSMTCDLGILLAWHLWRLVRDTTEPSIRDLEQRQAGRKE